MTEDPWCLLERLVNAIGEVVYRVEGEMACPACYTYLESGTGKQEVEHRHDCALVAAQRGIASARG